jgi:peptidoglycan/LPS O-acetylase OafA/YrhL
METSQRTKFHFLDGIRGLCAIFIAMYHAKLFTGHGLETNDLPAIFRPISDLLSLGHFSISFFIVLSGFCLMIPVAKSATGQLNGGTLAYLKRRARRILPPYYYALAIFVFLIWALPMLNIKQGTAWDSKIPMGLDSIVAHIFLIHNFSKEWVIKINGPMWSVATEWQIYFVFPILISLWRKYGFIASTTFGLLLGLIPSLILSPENDFRWAHPWYVGLFALGMASAVLIFSNNSQAQSIRSWINWRLAGAISLLALPANMIFCTYVVKLSPVISETITGALFCAILINYTTIELERAPRPLFLRLLSKDITIKLGAFSYSLYLVHSPVLAMFNLLTLDMPMSILTRFLMMQIVAVPCAIIISYVFFVLVEKRYTTSHVQTPKHIHSLS